MTLIGFLGETNGNPKKIQAVRDKTKGGAKIYENLERENGIQVTNPVSLRLFNTWLKSIWIITGGNLADAIEATNNNDADDLKQVKPLAVQ